MQRRAVPISFDDLVLDLSQHAPTVEQLSGDTGWAFETSDLIASGALVVSIIAVGVSMYNSSRASKKEDRRYAFDAAYGEPVREALARLENAIDLLCRAAIEPDDEKRQSEVRDLRHTLLDTWFFSLEGLLSVSRYRSANLVLEELFDVWDTIAVSIDEIAQPGFSHHSSQVLFGLNRKVHHFKSEALATVLEDRRTLKKLPK